GIAVLAALSPTSPSGIRCRRVLSDWHANRLRLILRGGQTLSRREPTHALFLASNTLLDIAFKAAQSSRQDANSNLVALLFSAAWFEASLNEAIYDLLERPELESSEQLHRIRLAADAAGLKERHVPIERRIRVLCAASTHGRLDVATPPWRDV